MAEPYKVKLYPWGLHPLPEWIKTELQNRAKEYDIDPLSQKGHYSGPKSAWIRMFSNGKSSLAPDKVGFVMGGTKGFDESYGFGSTGKITIGVDAYGRPHEVDALAKDTKNSPNDFPHRPPPSITALDCEFSGAGGSSFHALCRKTRVEWRCYSLNQLNYLIPYFLTPRISCLMEWGWSHYDTISLVDLTDDEWLKEIFKGSPEKTTDWIEASNGNYDLAMGFIVDYGYSLAEDGGYNCHTTIMNPNFLLERKGYQTASRKKTETDGSELKLKDFLEFSMAGLDNLIVSKKNSSTVSSYPTLGGAVGAGPARPVNNQPQLPVSQNMPLDFKSVQDKIFYLDKKIRLESVDGKKHAWLKMDLVADIINEFFKIEFKANDGNDVGTSAMTWDISNTIISGNPAIKSTNFGVLIPNKFAPRFVSKEGVNDRVATTLPANQYTSLFPEIASMIREEELSDEYDDLQAIINKNGESFPVYKDAYFEGVGEAKAGYYGYLKDIFVSVHMLQDLIQQNDTVLKLLEALLGRISEAMCNIAQLKLISPTYDNTAYSVYDTNFATITSRKQAEGLTRISLNSINSAFIKNAAFSIKLSQDMFGQLIFLSANEIPLRKSLSTENSDTKKIILPETSLGDRLFPLTSVRDTGKSDKGESSKTRLSRKFSTNNDVFLIKETPNNKRPQNTASGREGKTPAIVRAILAEKNPSYLQSVLMNIKNRRTVYTNNGIMPGTEFRMELLGIGGITYLSQFALDHVPSTYAYTNAVWQVDKVNQRVEKNTWTTSVTALVRPLTIYEVQ